MLTMTDKDKLRTLLPHWIEHNAEHAANFRLWAGRAGEAEAGLLAAVDHMEEANEALAAALTRLGGPLGSHGHEH